MKPRDIARSSLMAAIMVALSLIAVPLPVSPVPISLAVVGVFLCGGLLPPAQAFLAQAVYILLGAVGLPVFAGFAGGIGVLLGPTGGYIAAYPIMALVMALCVQASRQAGRAPRHIALLGGMVLALLCCYTLGTAWFVWQRKVSLAVALAACVVPFLAADALKIALCAVVVPILRSRLRFSSQGTQG